ncbi:MAG: hypothetical protein ACTSWC_00090 [Promethearchaeota archaeon]
MIIFHYDVLEQFLNQLPRNISSEVFIQYLEPNPELELQDLNSHQIILQFLGRPDDSNAHLNILHQCVININSKKERKEVVQRIETALNSLQNFKVVRGKISEVVHSY